MYKKNKLSPIALAMIATGFSALPTLAEEESSIETIMVTAQKRTERLQDVPISITNISADQIDKLGVNDFSQFAAAIPGLTMAKTGVGGARYFIRGVGQVTVNQSPTTGVYLDETPLQIRTSFGVAQVDPQLFDVQSVEVLRGPQGALFGSSSTGGAIRIKTNRADLDHFDANVGMTVSTTENGENNNTVTSMVNIPLQSINGALRIAARFDDQGGFIDDIRPDTNDVFANEDNLIKDINDVRSDSIRATFVIQPTDLLTLTSSVFYQDQHADQQRPTVDLTFSESAEVRKVHKYMDTFTDDETAIYSFEAQLDLSDSWGVSIVSATSYMDREVNGVFDLSPFSNGGIEHDFPKPAPNEDKRFAVGLYNLSDITQFTQEIRAVSTDKGPLDYVIGGFYKDVSTLTRADRTVVESYGAAVDPIVREAETDFDEQEIAIFGQLGYQLNEQFKLSIGGRYFSIDQDESRLQYGVGGAVRGSQDFGFAADTDESGFSPKAVVSYTPSDSQNIYLSYAEGFRSGGINAPIVDAVCSPEAREQFDIPQNPDPFESDETQTIELGTKLSLAEGRWQVFASAYKTDWQDYQLSVQQDCGPDSGVAVFTDNVGEVEINGFELETTFYPVEALKVTAGYAYTDAVFEGSNDVNLQARGISSGMNLFDVPENTWNLEFEYNFDLTDDLGGFVFSSAHYVDESLSGFGEGEAPLRPDYTLVNLRVGVYSDHWEVALFVNNLTDETVIHGLEFGASPGNTTATNDFSALVGQPRVMGVNVKYDW